MSQEKARHPLLIWLLIVGTGFVVMARAMSLPFLAIYLHQRMGLDAASIGLLLGTGALVGTFGGHLSDVLGRRKVLIGCLLVSSLSFAALHFAADAWQVFAVNLFINLASSFYEPVSKATISDNLPPEQRLRAFARRYLAINVGFAIGPLLGASLGLLDKSPVFLITGAVYLLFSIAIYAITARLVFGSPPHGAAASDLPLAAKLRIIGTDRRLILFTAGSMLAIGAAGFANSPNMTALVVSMVVFTWGEVLRSRRNTPSSTASRPSRCAASITARIRSATSATCSAHGSAASHCCTTAAPRCSTRWASSRC
ncbi:MFS transporter [Burkholderia oklahomensis]|uniref:MFS transporter n=1 Tax=Burkholderia oklahomensis TaxID=342113 RepID=UPI00016A8E2B|nr:MFS transporter [Burkholderia oklahomensis]AJX31736.1 sugar (and other) transporter family protein [Burkholderia oklahomensis C6786]AOI45889.1 MFS transporter permease [Burkholderia oklahomensis C6786]KUY52868.1 MFS transporter permease [Burkholderia oklahomensis C6786]MBI0361568.1 MFS transporter [Burkholderia oklahomensis]SUW55662.1 Multidrug resistance protein MdtH [Burkholderia oklahomensis]